MKITATARFVRMSSRKVRLVCDTIRGKSAEEALTILQFTNKHASMPVAKLLKSAVANAEHNFNLDKKNLVVRTITADHGPVLKRFLPRAFGRATPLRKPSVHIQIVLEDVAPAAKKKPASPKPVKKTA